MAPNKKFEEEVEREPVHMCHGQDGESGVARSEVEHFVCKEHVGPDGAVGQHDAFASSCGATGVTEQGKVFGMLTEVIHIGRLEVIEGFHVDAVRLVFHGEVGDVEDACLQPVGVFLTTDDEHGLGVIVDVLNLLDVELGEDGHHDCSIGEGCVEVINGVKK